MLAYTATDKGWIAKVRVTNKAELDSMMDQVLLGDIILLREHISWTVSE